MTCSHCGKPLIPGEIWNLYRCANRACWAYGRNVSWKPIATPFVRKHWSQRKRKTA
jgi:hypothetical protein